MKVLFIDDEIYRFKRMLETQQLHVTATHVDNSLKAIDAIVDDGPSEKCLNNLLSGHLIFLHCLQ